MTILETYRRLVPFLGAALGKDCEVVLHDLRHPDASVVAIANGEISGRKVGAPATDFILKLMQVGKKRDQEYMTNYYGKSFNGHTLRSSTYFLHDEDGSIVGALCLNYDVQRYIDVRRQLDQLILMDPDKTLSRMAGEADKKEDEPFLGVEISESMYPTVEDAIQHLIQRALAPYATDAKRLSQQERLRVVEDLYKNGLFVLKGGVYALAQALGVSEPTIYRYLNRVKKSSERQ
ncbi:transcriptional regulator [Megasphaera sp.]|uniref:helix-turn-helix transcriptional regulator n=1 Tax=Megasphaera sp. TaxID=2023260 RepID=UPI0025DDCC16|nr:helix-turn-helix transcriptional regulator [uncultured Megasphaera sp.]